MLDGLGRRASDARRITGSVALRLVAMALGVAASVAIARLGGADAKGVASTFTAIASTVYVVANLGIAEQVVELASAKGFSARRLLRRIWLWYVGVTLVAAAGVVWIDSSFGWLMAGCLIYILFAQVNVVALGLSGVLVQAWGIVLQPLAVIVLTVAFFGDGD